MIPDEIVQDKIYLIRDKKVMLDRDLAQLYNVETKVLKQAVRRNIDRFPEDFMFELSNEEFTILRSQIVTSSWGGRRYNPYAFTEQGVAMLSSILRSKRAIEVNIAIMRTFVKLRQILATNDLLRHKIESIERKYDEQFQQVFAVLKNMLTEEAKPKRQIGYHAEAKGHERKVKKKKAKSTKTSKKKPHGLRTHPAS
ncbi:MAG: ORF6N domain-containing protein [Candidatus Omnitrophica bacterium]|nr:ORF6N domain-containing protein [Candidatus Omnitrophota bacterium]